MATITKRHWATRKGEKRSAWLLSWQDLSGQRHKRQFLTKAEANHFRIDTEGRVQAGTFRAATDRVTIKDGMRSFLTRLRGTEPLERADVRA